MVNFFLLLLLPISLQFLLSQPIIASSADDEPIPAGESLPTDANATAAKTLMPPEPTDQMPVSTAYFNQKTYSIREFHELVAGLNADIKNGFKKVEEESGRLSDVIARLDGRMDKLEGWLGWKWLDRTGLANWPCLVLTGMAVLLLAVALLVLCNTLLIKRVLGGAAAAASAAAANSTTARREKTTAKKDKEMVGLVQKETV